MTTKIEINPTNSKNTLAEKFQTKISKGFISVDDQHPGNFDMVNLRARMKTVVLNP